MEAEKRKELKGKLATLRKEMSEAKGAPGKEVRAAKYAERKAIAKELKDTPKKA